MDGYFFFSDSETGAPFTAIIRIGTDRTMWNITTNVCLKEEYLTHIGCLEGE